VRSDIKSARSAHEPIPREVRSVEDPLLVGCLLCNSFAESCTTAAFYMNRQLSLPRWRVVMEGLCRTGQSLM
jgi:hypothetical protein